MLEEKIFEEESQKREVNIDLLSQSQKKSEKERLLFYGEEDGVKRWSRSSVFMGRFDHEILSDEKALELVREYKKTGEKEVINTLIVFNMRFIAKIARKYTTWSDMDFEELVHEGVFGFVKGVDKFEERGINLTTYTAWWIRLFIERAIFDTSKTIRFPVHVWEHAGRVMESIRISNQRTLKNPTFEEIVEFTNLTKLEVKNILNVKNISRISINQPAWGMDGEEMFFVLPDNNSLKPESVFEAKQKLHILIEKVEDIFLIAENILSSHHFQIFQERYCDVIREKLLKPKTLNKIEPNIEKVNTREGVGWILGSIWRKLSREFGVHMDENSFLALLKRTRELEELTYI